MTPFIVPDWLRIILSILSLLSFVPQLHRTVSKKDSSGISVCYLLLNLISATEQFALAFFYSINYAYESDVFVQDPVSTGDWLNLAQTAVVAALWLVLLAVCLYFPSDHRDASATFALSAYFAFLLISILPIAIDAIHPGDRSQLGGRWFEAIWASTHTMLINWTITALGAAAFYYQIREVLSRPWSQALSLVGIAAQAMVFAIVAVSWVFRIRFPYKFFETPTFGLLVTWYQLVGWAAVDNLVFALGQVVLLWIASRHAASRRGIPAAETEPLLHT